MKHIKRINELIDQQVLNDLNIKKIDRSKYFFSHKEINQLYDAHIFEILVKDMNLDTGGKAVLINLLLINSKTMALEFFIWMMKMFSTVI